jgi:hypothetical protein
MRAASRVEWRAACRTHRSAQPIFNRRGTRCTLKESFTHSEPRRTRRSQGRDLF